MKQKLLTIKQLKATKPNTIFASGTEMNGQSIIQWVAVRGGIHDWAIYFGRIDQSQDEIKRHGMKLFSEEKIKECVPCDDKSFKMYRY